MPQVDFAHYPFISQFFWLFISFALLYFYSSKIILPRISKTLEHRNKTIQEALNEAEKIKNDASSYIAECENLLDKARSEAADIIAKAEEKIEKQAQAQAKKIDKEIAKQISDAEDRIADFKTSNEKIVTELSDEIYNNLIKKYAS